MQLQWNGRGILGDLAVWLVQGDGDCTLPAEWVGLVLRCGLEGVDLGSMMCVVRVGWVSGGSRGGYRPLIAPQLFPIVRPCTPPTRQPTERSCALAGRSAATLPMCSH